MVLKNNRINNPKNKQKLIKNKSNIKAKDSLKANNYYWIITFLLLVLADRLTKLFAARIQDALDYKIVSLHFVTNTGAGFSILTNHNTALIWLSIIIAGIAIYFYNMFPKIAFVMIMSGLTSNLIDRIVHGYVIDFIDFKFWPVFNIADSLICIGVIITIISILVRDLTTGNSKKKTLHAHQ
jgi:signal peptidase II